ncbi:MAG: hypothetical protein ACI9KN_002484 [Gammaproteobacteria bacterium]
MCIYGTGFLDPRCEESSTVVAQACWQVLALVYSLLDSDE